MGLMSLQAEAPKAGEQNAGLGPILFNEDGDFTFVGADATEWRANLPKMLNQLKEIPAKTIVYSLGTGTDVLLYPSKAGSSWGWRGKNEVPDKLGHIKNFPVAVQSGLDGVRWAAEDSIKLGLKFVPAFRMNDAHYASGQSPYLEGEFWEKNRDKYTFKVPPYPIGKLQAYKELLDYSHPEVRAHRLAVIEEAVERYQDVMDGFLLDFMRVPMFFPLNEVKEKSKLMTELMAKIRASLDKAEAATGRKMPLLVRVPPTIKNCETVGLDIRSWVKDGLVQVIIPSQVMTLTHDTPVEEFLKIAKPAGVKVYLSIYERTGFTYAFTPHAPQSGDYTGREATEQLIRGATMNYRAMGVDGFELYNFNLPMTDFQIAAFRDMAEGVDNTTKARTYAVTPAYFFDNLDTYEPPKQVPFQLNEKAREKTVRIYIGEDPRKIAAGSHVGLRVGLVAPVPSAVVKVAVNGTPLKDEELSSPVSKGPAGYQQYGIKNPAAVLKPGWNEITVSALPGNSAPVTVSEIQLGVLPPSA